MTMVATYPSPMGIYKNIITTADATLARNSGNVLLAPNGTGSVGIGTPTPGFMLDVNGTSRFQGTVLENNTVELWNQAADPATCANGMIYYNTTTSSFRGCANGSWQSLGIASTGIYGYCLQVGSASGCSNVQSPATCNGGSTCSCPSAYTMVLMGASTSGYEYYSCYKN